jgi:hypothetical protein
VLLCICKCVDAHAYVDTCVFDGCVQFSAHTHACVLLDEQVMSACVDTACILCASANN